MENTKTPETEPQDPSPANLDANARWYVLHTYSNYEVVAKDNLEKVIRKEKLENRIFEIFIPTEDTVVERREKKVLVPTKTMPSYLFVKMIYGDDIWHTITRTNGITGFVGPKGRPLPLNAKEVADMKLERKVNNIITKVEVGDTVHVIDGQLAGQTAVVTAVDTDSGKCTIKVTMFGRPTPVDLELFKVKKI
jgi:transcriptional antiterminator NusG